MAEALLQSAVKRALEQSVSGTNNLTSTPQKSNQGLNSKRSKLDVALDKSIISSANDFLSDSIDGAVENIATSKLSAKNKKAAEAVLKEMKASLINAVNKALELFFDDIVNQMNMKMDSIKEAVQKSALLAHYEADKLEQYSRRESFRISGMNIPDETESSELIEMVCKLAGDIGIDLEKNQKFVFLKKHIKLHPCILHKSDRQPDKTEHDRKLRLVL